MSASGDSIQVAQLGGNKIASTQIINNAILNAVLITFQRNDQLFKQAASGIYQYGPKSFIRQLQTATGVCDMTRSLTALTEDVRNGAAGTAYQISGYCYNKHGYKVWCNVAPQNAYTVSAETSSLLANLGYSLNYGVMSSDLTYLSGGQEMPADPEIYSFDGDASSPNRQDYFTKTVTANSYLLSTESEKVPSNWRQQLHTTFDYEPVSAACKAYFTEHQRDTSPYDSMGCLTHYIKNSHLFTEKVVASLSNFQSVESNGFADTISWYWHGTKDVNTQVSSPAYACAATSAKPEGPDQEGYQMTDDQLNRSYSNLENLIGISETKKTNCTFILYASGRFDMYVDLPNVTTYIPEISFKNKISGTKFAAEDKDAVGFEYSPNNNLSVIVFPNLKLKNSTQEIQFPLHTITQGYKNGTLKVSSAGTYFVGYTSEPATLDATTLPPGNYNAVPPYIKNAGDKLIVGPIQYKSSCVYIGPAASAASSTIKKIKRADVFSNQKPYPLINREWISAKVGTDPVSDTEMQYTINVSYISPSNSFVGCDLVCVTLDQIGYSSEWTHTRVKFSWKGLVEAIMSERSEQPLKYSVQIGSAVANAKTMASDRYQVGSDTALYPESKVFDVNDSDMIIELFNSDNQTLRISGTITVEQ